MKIDCQDLAKRYKYEWILKNFSYTFSASNQYAIAGRNGSGKSTLLRLLAGYLTPSTGKISFFSPKEEKITPNAIHQYLSIAAPYIELIEEFTLLEAIQFHLHFKSFINSLSIPEFLAVIQLESAQNKQIRHFSSGMKQRLKLGLAICSDSPLLLLDEPTTNLDQDGANWYKQLIEKHLDNRIVMIASNVNFDFDFCTERINVESYKPVKKKKAH